MLFFVLLRYPVWPRLAWHSVGRVDSVAAKFYDVAQTCNVASRR
jgi:hypothetical protein